MNPFYDKLIHPHSGPSAEDLDLVCKRLDAPFYFYNLDQLKSHLEEINSFLHPDIKLWYACKANPMSGVLKVLRNLKFAVDVASKGELFQVLNTGIKGENILATGPGKSKEYLRHLILSGVKTVVAESQNQVLWLNEVAQEENISVNCLLRLQLEWTTGESVLGGAEITPFGLGLEDWQGFQLADYPHLQFLGLHVFQWGNVLEVQELVSIWEQIIARSLTLAKDLKMDLKVLDLGGGLGIPYNANQKAISFREVHDELVKLKEKYQLDKIWMELGRYTVGEIGHYFTKIIDRKVVRGKNILVVEGGINHMARVALTKESFPASMYRRSSEKELTFQVHGPLCTALDKLGTYHFAQDIGVGDWIVFHQAGAYGFTESMPYFLCHSLAGEVVYYQGDMMIPRPPRESYEWMI